MLSADQTEISLLLMSRPSHIYAYLDYKNKNKNIYLSFLAIHTALMITANMFELYDVIVWALMDANST